MRGSLLASISFAASLSAVAMAAPDAPPTFHRDVLPVLQQRCQGCHRPGEIGPMPLLTYQQARPWAKAIRAAVLQKTMPPWFADPAHGRFSNDRTLSQAEIDALAGWAASGALEGDPRDAPPPAQWSDGWSIGEPDVIVEMPVEFQIPATGTIPYQYVIFPTGFTEDKWVERVEVRPGNRAVVHHQIASVAPHNAATERIPHGQFFDLESSPNRPGSDKTTMFAVSATGETLQVFVPGGNAPALAPGQARLVKAGSDILMQLHYTSIGTPATDKTRIGFVFAKQPPTQRVRGVLIYNTDFTIPAGSPNAMVMAAAEVRSDLELVSLLPHMHLRGKSFSYRATYPDGTQEILLDVPRYDFNWQITYYLKEPKLLPRGTVLECVGHYDNSQDNPFNPDPTADVHYGDQTWEEMLNGFMEVAIDPEKPQEIFGPAPKRDAPAQTSSVRPSAAAPAAAARAASAAAASATARVAATKVSFHKDVEPILQEHCQGCHRPGEIAPMPFLAYDEVRPWAKAIRAAVLRKQMPPWGADPNYGEFVNDRSLSEQEIDTLVSWVESGALQGNPADAPEPLRFEQGWNIGKPDAIVSPPKPFAVPASGTIDYRYVVFPSGFTEDKWVERVEVRPGNPAVLHHVNVFASPPSSKSFAAVERGRYFEFPAKPGNDPEPFSFAKNGTEALHGFAPGGVPTIFAPGQARLVKAGSDIIYQLHYQAGGAEALDLTKVGFVFAKAPPTERITSVTVQNFDFTIPPLADDYPVKAEALLNVDVKLVSMLPHMHLRGKKFVIRAYYPDGRDETLVSVPRYDFNWQTTYVLATPKLLPKGTRLESIGWYDNTANNPSNPDPNALVIYGEQTWNEMMGGVMDLAVDPALESPVIFTRVPREASSQVSQVEEK
jgi:mono/diheme cytochrome c family protein